MLWIRAGPYGSTQQRIPKQVDSTNMHRTWMGYFLTTRLSNPQSSIHGPRRHSGECRLERRTNQFLLYPALVEIEGSSLFVMEMDDTTSLFSPPSSICSPYPSECLELAYRSGGTSIDQLTRDSRIGK